MSLSQLLWTIALAMVVQAAVVVLAVYVGLLPAIVLGFGFIILNERRIRNS